MVWRNNRLTEQKVTHIHRAIATLLAEHATLAQRLQQLERESLSRELSVCLRELHAAVEVAAQQGSDAACALETGLRASVAPLPRGKAGGLARARTGWRYGDGTFMSEWKKRETYFEEQERHARGGRARVATARRYPDGTFAPNASDGHLDSGDRT